MTQIPSTGPAGQPGSQDPVGSAGGVLRSLPKISLHDHLDGGLRPQTLLELAEAAGTEPPADSAAELEQWMRESADSRIHCSSSAAESAGGSVPAASASSSRVCGRRPPSR